MLVGDVLNLVAQLSMGLDSPTADDQKIWLGYLNLAHFDLFAQTATVNAGISIQTDQLNVTNGVCDPFTQPIYSIRSAYQIDTNRILQPSTYDKILKQDPGRQIQADPTSWYVINGRLNTWPLATLTTVSGSGVGVIYNTQPVVFGLNDDLSLYYPLAFHPILVDGTCYYMFQSESGFSNQTKMQSSEMKWSKGKTNLFNYFVALGGKTSFSTFSRL
jgi:hypothetical protein